MHSIKDAINSLRNNHKSLVQHFYADNNSGVRMYGKTLLPIEYHWEDDDDMPQMDYKLGQTMACVADLILADYENEINEKAFEIVGNWRGVTAEDYERFELILLGQVYATKEAMEAVVRDKANWGERQYCVSMEDIQWHAHRLLRKRDGQDVHLSFVTSKPGANKPAATATDVFDL